MKKFLSYINLLNILCVISLSAFDQSSCSFVCDRQNECSPIPLRCQEFNIYAYGGFCPISWTHRSELKVVAAAPAALVTVSKLANFRHYFRMPWIVGFDIGYAWTNNDEIYAEFNYLQARPTVGGCASTVDLNGIPYVLDLIANSKYRGIGAYVGLRHYWDRCRFERISFFLGGKLGFYQRNGVNAYIISGTISSPNIVTYSPLFNLFDRNIGISGGIEGGFDLCLDCDWSFILRAQIIANCPTHSFEQNFVAAAGLPFNNVVIGSMQSELLFPITFGLRYKF